MDTMKARYWHPSLILSLLTLAGLHPIAEAQTNEQVRVAFQNIRSDTIPLNGRMAAEWLFKYRNRLKAALLDELYKTDRQGRDVIMTTLFATRGFHPDARFCQMMMARVNEEERHVPNWTLGVRAHWACWDFVHSHYETLKPYVLANLEKTDNMLCVWSSVWLLSMHHDLDAEVPKFSERVWDLAERNLANDEQSYNAGQAVRFYLIIGKLALPRLETAKKSKDAQTRALSAATIDAMGGSRRAYGYLGSEVHLLHSPVGTVMSKNEPEWMFEEVQKWLSKR